jgi:integrase
MKRRQGNISKRGENSWQIKFDAPSVDGKRRQRYATVRGSYKDAQKKLTELLNEADKGMLAAPTRSTVGEYMQSWLDTATGRAPKTLERYRELFAWQIRPHLGEVPLQKLRPEAIRHWYAALVVSGLAPRTVHHAHRLLRQVLDCAVKDGKLSRNVADVHAPPKVKRTEVEILPADRIGDVLAALEGHTLYPIVALALGTGMRRGELLGLQWGDVDLDSAKLQVKRSLEETKAGLRLKEPKTDGSLRTIALPPQAVAMLREHKVEQMKFRLAVGVGKIDTDTLVFSDANGKPLSPHAVSRAWRRIVEAKKLPRVTFHALRHTHVSVLIAAGQDILSISRRIGHARASMTLDVYGHLMGGSDEAAAAVIAKVLK